MQKKGWIVISLLLVLGLFSCQNNVLYKESKRISGNTWEYAELLCFPFEIQDTSELYEINLSVNHLTQFPSQNQYVKIHTSFPDGSTKEDILSLELAGNTGWKGNCRGERCTVNIPLQAETYFNDPGPYKLCFEQYSRKDSIEGIASMELKISKLSK